MRTYRDYCTETPTHPCMSIHTSMYVLRASLLVLLLPHIHRYPPWPGAHPHTREITLHALRHYDAESRRASSAVCGAHVNPNPKSQSVLPSSTRINPTHRYTPKHGRGHASPPCGQKAPWDVRSTQTGLSSLAMSSPLVRVASTLVAITQNKNKTTQRPEVNQPGSVIAAEVAAIIRGTVPQTP